MTYRDYFLLGLLAFLTLVALCALAVDYAGRGDQQDMSNGYWRDM